MKLIDSHCHLDFSQFSEDREEVITNAKSNGVADFIIPGVQASQWQNLIEYCADHEDCHYSLGIHPYFLESYQASDIEQLDNLLRSSNAVAVGECGIDSVIENLPLQQSVFEAQIRLANEHGKPIIVHHRRSHHLIQQSFKKVKPRFGGAIHAFSGSEQDATKYLELGFKFGVGGTITYARANKTREAIRQLPLTSLLLETDSPDMPLFGKQGERNEPKYLPLVLQKLAELTDQPVEALATQIELNTRALFNV